MESCPQGTIDNAPMQNENFLFKIVNLLTVTITLCTSALYALSGTLTTSHSLAKMYIKKHLYSLLCALQSYYKPNSTW